MLQELMVARGRNDGTIRVEGSIAAHNRNAFAQILGQDVVALAEPGTVDLDLSELELTDDEALDTAVDGIHTLLLRHRVTLRNPPLALAEKLNESIDLEESALDLVDPRGPNTPTLM